MSVEIEVNTIEYDITSYQFNTTILNCTDNFFNWLINCTEQNVVKRKISMTKR